MAQALTLEVKMERLLKKIDKLKVTVPEAIRLRGMTRGMAFFEADIIKNQMSGRPGLKRPTGNLAKSWRIKTTKEGVKLQVLDRAWYAAVHQKWKTTSKSDHIPKRLHIIERYVTTGNDIILRNVRKAVNHAAKIA